MPNKYNIPLEKLTELLNKGKTRRVIAKELGVDRTVIDNRMKEYGLVGFSRVRYDLMDVKDPIFCYLLGWYCTDGYLTKLNRVSLRTDDKEVIDALAAYFKCRQYVIPRAGNKVGHDLYFAKAPAIFRNLFDDNKTTSIRFPEIPVENIDMFLRGVIEGDGCIRIPGTHKSSLIRVFSMSNQFAQALQSNIFSLGYPCKIRKDRMGWEISTSSIDFAAFVYKRFPDFVCNRKKDRVVKWLSI